MKKVGLIFPNQLFKNPEISKHTDNLFLIEYSLFFGEKKYINNFHKKKLILHRASMKCYFKEVLEKYKSHYIEYDNSDFDVFLGKYSNIEEIVIYEPKDFLLKKRISKYCSKNEISLTIISNPQFLTPPDFYNEYFEKHKYFMTPFYIEQRKRLDILVKDGKPANNKWTFDNENRLKLPKNLKIPDIKFFGENEYVKEAVKYVEKNFSNNIGNSSDFFYPINHKEAINQLHDFLENRIQNFGPFEDAISNQGNFLFHSNLSSSINIGLLTPTEVVSETLEYAKNHNVHFPSLEGFIRQIIGWREFMMIIYERDGTLERNSNYFNHNNKITNHFYSAETEILPVDDVISKANNIAYAHHIERLMILGNFMCLCEINPNEIYKWFMEYFIDAYDWVMVPNVYGMSQYADGGLITTKPYISSSNYILKMSDYKSNEPWCHIWDGLFWRFLSKNESKLRKNPRIGLLVNQLKKTEIKDKVKIGEKYLNKMF